MKADGGVITQIRVVLPEPVETNFPRGTNNQKYYPDLVSDRHLYRISALVCETLFHGKTGGGVAKCRLFSQTVHCFTLCYYSLYGSNFQLSASVSPPFATLFISSFSLASVMI